MNVLRNDFSPDIGDWRRLSILYPFLNLPQARVQADRKGIFTRHLHTVIFLRIVRSRDLHGSLEAVIGGTEIYHRRGAETDVVHISASIGYSFHEIFMNLRGRKPAVAPDQDFISF